MSLNRSSLSRLTVGCLAVGMSLTSTGVVLAQQVTIGTPFHTVSDSFFEQQGINFGFNIHGGNPNGQGTRIVGLLPNGAFAPNGDIQFRQGSSGAALPPFGGFDPTRSSRAGFAVLGRNADLFLNFDFAQGSSTTHTMQAPSVTVMNGQTGSISDQTQTPFITSVTPIVGGFVPGYGFAMPPQAAAALMSAPASSPLLERYDRLRAGERPKATAGPAVTAPPREPTFVERVDAARQSTAGQPALSIVHIEAQQSQVDQAAQEAAGHLMDRAREAEEAGKPGLAKIYYRMAAKEAGGALKEDAEKRLRALSGTTSTSDGGLTR